MAARLIEKLRMDSEAPDAGHPDRVEGVAPGAPPASHGKMATPPQAPPGIELDSHGDPIPLAQRTARHRAQADGSRQIDDAD